MTFNNHKFFHFRPAKPPKLPSISTRSTPTPNDSLQTTTAGREIRINPTTPRLTPRKSFSIKKTAATLYPMLAIAQSPTTPAMAQFLISPAIAQFLSPVTTQFLISPAKAPSQKSQPSIWAKKEELPSEKDSPKVVTMTYK